MTTKPLVILNRPEQPGLQYVKPANPKLVKLRSYHFLVTRMGVSPLRAKILLGLQS